MKWVLFISSVVIIFWGCGPKLSLDQKSVNKVLSDYTSALQKGLTIENLLRL
jgi:hypothetical protein